MHPMIKFKENEMKSKEEVLVYMVNEADLKLEKGIIKKIKEFSHNILDQSRKYKLTLITFCNSFCIRPGKRFKLPVIVYNPTKQTVPACNMLLLCRNNKDLKLSPLVIVSEMDSHEQYELMLEGESNSQLKRYDFELFLFSTNLKIESNSLRICIEVNEDEEEERMNEFLAMHSKIISLAKKQKEIIIRIIRENISIKHPYVIYNILMKHRWNVDEAIEDLREGSI